MTAAEADREQRLAEGKVDAAKLPRLLTGVVVTAVIAASVWVLSGATLPFPEIFTGGVNPLIWRPIPAVDAFDMPPRTFDLTPLVGSLVDGGSHTISLSVADAQS